MLRLWFSFLGVLLVLILLWGSLWAGFENFDLIAAVKSQNSLQRTVFVIFNYGAVVVAAWLLRGGPKLIRNRL